jgi:hypothetical protein
MDREEDAISKGLILGSPFDDSDANYGGKIAYSIVVRPETRFQSQVVMPDVPKPPEFEPFKGKPRGYRTNSLPCSMSLCEPDMPGKSFRLARRFGSRRIISFKLRDFRSSHDPMSLFVGRILVVCGRTFRAIWAPPDRDAVFAVETSESGDVVATGELAPSFAQWIASESQGGDPDPTDLAVYNDPSQKPNQAMAKCATAQAAVSQLTSQVGCETANPILRLGSRHHGESCGDRENL